MQSAILIFLAIPKIESCQIDKLPNMEKFLLKAEILLLVTAEKVSLLVVKKLNSVGLRSTVHRIHKPQENNTGKRSFTEIRIEIDVRHE